MVVHNFNLGGNFVEYNYKVNETDRHIVGRGEREDGTNRWNNNAQKKSLLEGWPKE